MSKKERERKREQEQCSICASTQDEASEWIIKQILSKFLLSDVPYLVEALTWGHILLIADSFS